METVRYKEHAGTLKISGKTAPRAAAHCAFTHFLEGKVSPIDFFYIGGNAGQQAMKAMGVFATLVTQHSNGAVRATFEPLKFMTLTIDDQGTEKEKDATVWRTILVRPL